MSDNIGITEIFPKNIQMRCFSQTVDLHGSGCSNCWVNKVVEVFDERILFE